MPCRAARSQQQGNTAKNKKVFQPHQGNIGYKLCKDNKYVSKNRRNGGNEGLRGRLAVQRLATLGEINYICISHHYNRNPRTNYQ